MAKNVFISWSKPRSHRVASALSEFTSSVIQAAQPWISSDDISKGKLWRTEISSALNNFELGIIVLTPENQHEPWVNFEAGALSSGMRQSDRLICPYLIDIQTKDVEQPLSAFNLTHPTLADTKRMMVDLGSRLSPSVKPEIIAKQVDLYFPSLDKVIKDVISTPATSDILRERPAADITNEMIDLLRSINSKVTESYVLEAIPKRVELINKIIALGQIHPEIVPEICQIFDVSISEYDTIRLIKT